MKEVVSNINNSLKTKADATKAVAKQASFPVKSKILSMEKDQAKSKTESEEFMQKHKTITAHKLIENIDDEPKIAEIDQQVEKNGNHSPESNGVFKNGKAQCDVPPKPLPRKSISEQGSFEENCVVIIPKPRPRTACQNSSYKV